MAEASAYSLFKAALVSQLSARAGLTGVQVGYAAASRPEEVRAETGSYEWITMDGEGANAEGSMDGVVFCGPRLTFDETYSQVVTIQVLNPTSEGTQQETDRRCQEILYEVLAEIAAHASWDKPALDLDQFSLFVCGIVPGGETLTFRFETGILEGTGGTNPGHGTKCVLNIPVYTRRHYQ